MDLRHGMLICTRCTAQRAGTAASISGPSPSLNRLARLLGVHLSGVYTLHWLARLLGVRVEGTIEGAFAQDPGLGVREGDPIEESR